MASGQHRTIARHPALLAARLTIPPLRLPAPPSLLRRHEACRRSRCPHCAVRHSRPCTVRSDLLADRLLPTVRGSPIFASTSQGDDLLMQPHLSRYTANVVLFNLLNESIEVGGCHSPQNGTIAIEPTDIKPGQVTRFFIGTRVPVPRFPSVLPVDELCPPASLAPRLCLCCTSRAQSPG